MVNSGWFQQRYSAIKEAAGIRWQIFGFLVALAIGRLDWLYQKIINQPQTPETAIHTIFGFPSWILGVTVALFLLFYWLLEYAVKLRRQIKGARAELASLRSLGVEIRNHGLQLRDEAAWKDWAIAAENWNKEVYKSLQKISEADAELFRVLDVLPSEPRVPYIPLNEDHKKLLSEHDCRLDRLGTMVYSRWRE